MKGAFVIVTDLSSDEIIARVTAALEDAGLLDSLVSLKVTSIPVTVSEAPALRIPRRRVAAPCRRGQLHAAASVPARVE